MTEQNNTTNSLAHTKWNCKYHIVFAPKYRRTVGKNTKAISEYISHQLKEDELGSQLTLAEPDPFTGSK